MSVTLGINDHKMSRGCYSANLSLLIQLQTKAPAFSGYVIVLLTGQEQGVKTIFSVPNDVMTSRISGSGEMNPMSRLL